MDLERQQRGDVTIVRVSGEIDLANAEVFLRRTLDAIETASRVVVDLTGVTYIDSAGLRQLLDLSQRSQQGRVRLACVLNARTARVVELMGIAGVLPSAESVEEATDLVSQ